MQEVSSFSFEPKAERTSERSTQYRGFTSRLT